MTYREKIREILEAHTHLFDSNYGRGWWGHDTDLGTMKPEFNESVNAIVAVTLEVIGATEQYLDIPPHTLIDEPSKVVEMGAELAARNDLRAQLREEIGV